MIKTGIISTIININLTLSTFKSGQTLTGTLADTINRYSAIQTLNIIDFTLVDIILAVWFRGALGTMDAFV